jgi:hypothetical protein
MVGLLSNGLFVERDDLYSKRIGLSPYEQEVLEKISGTPRPISSC